MLPSWSYNHIVHKLRNNLKHFLKDKTYKRFPRLLIWSTTSSLNNLSVVISKHTLLNSLSYFVYPTKTMMYLSDHSGSSEIIEEDAGPAQHSGNQQILWLSQAITTRNIDHCWQRLLWRVDLLIEQQETDQLSCGSYRKHDRFPSNWELNFPSRDLEWRNKHNSFPRWRCQ